MQADKFTSCMDWQRPNIASSIETVESVSRILNNIKANGDKEIDRQSLTWDGFYPNKIRLKPFEYYDLSENLRLAIKNAAQRIEQFCVFQKYKLQDANYESAEGCFGFRYQPIERIGAYIPGGRFPLISTALMTLIPAKIAGSKERIACSPSNHPAILAAASLAGATEFLHIGGVQAIAALAMGYKNINPVQMVVGPGNQYVNTAKQLLQNTITIDVAAGPSELLILANGRVNLKWIMADMAAQAEHDPQAISVLVSDDIELLIQVNQLIKKNSEISNLLSKGQIVLLQSDNREQMISFSDRFSPEHLLLVDGRINADELKHYGSLFIGENSAVAFGDYCSGPNHTLPTMGTANRSSGLSVLSFMKLQSVQTVSDVGRLRLAEIGKTLAEAEQLVWHKRSMQVRSSTE